MKKRRRRLEVSTVKSLTVVIFVSLKLALKKAAGDAAAVAEAVVASAAVVVAAVAAEAATAVAAEAAAVAGNQRSRTLNLKLKKGVSRGALSFL